MRYDTDHKSETRDRVLKAAARSMRDKGPHKLGVAAVMAEAGLTHGGFYAHFPSREALITATVERLFDDSRSRFAAETEGLSPPEAFARYVDFYLSASHRDTRTAGCPLPFLSADAFRLPRRRPRGVRRRESPGWRENLAGLLFALGGEAARAQAGSVARRTGRRAVAGARRARSGALRSHPRPIARRPEGAFRTRAGPMSRTETSAPPLTGIEQLRAGLEAIGVQGIGKTLGFRVVEIEEGRVVFAGSPGREVYNPIGVVHGGYAATLLDSACGCAVHSQLSADQAYTTLELKVAYHRRDHRETGEVRAEGRVIQMGRRAAFAEAKLTDSAGRLYASATSTLLVMQR